MNHVLKKRNRLRGKTENEKLYNDNMVLAGELKEDIQIIINSHEKPFVNKKDDKDESD